jgi:hypothetical protein
MSEPTPELEKFARALGECLTDMGTDPAQQVKLIENTWDGLPEIERVALSICGGFPVVMLAARASGQDLADSLMFASKSLASSSFVMGVIVGHMLKQRGYDLPAPRVGSP